MDWLKLIKIAVSLGDAETRIQPPALMTHTTYSEDQLKEAGISETLVRMPVGLKNVNDVMT